MEGGNYDNHDSPLPLPIGFSNNNLKLEILEDGFAIDNFSSSKPFFQDFQHLDNFPLDFDPLLHVSSLNFDMPEFKPFQENGAAIQDFHGGGCFNLPNSHNLLNFGVPDESSCVTAENYGCRKRNAMRRGKIRKNNSNESDSISTRKTDSRARRKSKSAKGQWTNEEDKLLIHLVEKYGVRKWSHIAQTLKGRIGKQCRERWHNHLRPDIKKDVWTEEEDRMLIEAHAEIGNKWAEIAKRLPGRTENSIKNHWNATKRRQFSKRKCRTKWPRPSSVLQNYIKSLSLEKSGSSSNKLRNINSPSPPASTTAPARMDNLAASIDEPKHEEWELHELNDCTVPNYDFDGVPEFIFEDDGLFEQDGMETFVDNLPEMDGLPEFDIDLKPFDFPALMRYEREERA